ncbi:hypothetical protein [Streptomyces sp. CoT10]|uniref:hypothetical protein n=1 Tax=Streptomyces sp. CoT10 TaxID=2875762 RepID=UPI001CD26359|nr:hypothetical protein [Streptomyces sp. CoT10]
MPCSSASDWSAGRSAAGDGDGAAGSDEEAAGEAGAGEAADGVAGCDGVGRSETAALGDREPVTYRSGSSSLNWSPIQPKPLVTARTTTATSTGAMIAVAVKLPSPRGR